MKKERDPDELAQELLEQADETRRLIARFPAEDGTSSAASDGWRAKALLACLKNDQAILEALGHLLGRKPAPGAEPLAAPPPEASSLSMSDALTAGEGLVEGTRAREIVIEFDNRDHVFERGLEKLNSWCAGGKGALPFQKRDRHAYLNRGASSETMVARVESELMGREGFTRRLGRLKVEGLEGDILVYEKGA